jgi:hypothetical protein
VARQRLIAPDFFVHAELHDAEERSGLPLRLAFAGLWTQADRRGVFPWKPRELQLAVLPYDRVSMGAVLEALAAGGFIRAYDVDGRTYGYIPSFGRWQTFNVRERPSRHPAPPDTVPAPAQHRVHPGQAAGGTRNATPAAAPAAQPAAPQEVVPQPAAAAPYRHSTSTGPAPDAHRASTCSTGTGTGTGTGTTAVQPHPAGVAVAAAAAPTATAETPTAGEREALVQLTVAANRGLAVRYGEQPNPLRWSHPGAAELWEALHAAGVPLAWAALQLEQLAAACTLPRPPRSVRYWAGALVEAWQLEESRPGTPADTLPGTTPDGIPIRMAVRYAQQGDAEWQAYCTAHGLPWQDIPTNEEGAPHA